MLCNTLHLGLASACAVSNESDSTEALVMVVCLFVCLSLLARTTAPIYWSRELPKHRTPTTQPLDATMVLFSREVKLLATVLPSSQVTSQYLYVGIGKLGDTKVRVSRLTTSHKHAAHDQTRTILYPNTQTSSQFFTCLSLPSTWSHQVQS
jgi:hypothetical protein